MARVSLSALLDDITGKLSGSVFQNSFSGLQLRTRVSPRNPATVHQQRTRSLYGFTALNYNLLSSANRQTWIDNAPVGVTGSGFYITVNQKVALTGQPLLSAYTPPGLIEVPTITIDSLSSSAFDIDVALSSDPLPSGYYINLFATPQLRPATGFISPSTYRFLLTLPPGTSITSPISILSAYTARFGTPVAGNVIGLKYYSILPASGGSITDQTAVTAVS